MQTLNSSGCDLWEAPIVLRLEAPTMTYDTPVFFPKSFPIMGGDCTQERVPEMEGQDVVMGSFPLSDYPSSGSPPAREEGPIVQVWDFRYGSFLWTLEEIWAME